MNNDIEKILSGELKGAQVSLWLMFFEALKHGFGFIFGLLALASVIFAVSFRWIAVQLTRTYAAIQAYTGERVEKKESGA